ncbi:hypothetical protein [Brassicibacter mesophilus]|uniref:hypothetical protein n=1 Tax=Brassicibacter mesophilus TaxID=745119 RepID=UPI003D214CC3
MQVESDFLKKYNVIDYEVKLKFYSKKNNVYKVEFKCINEKKINLVVKIFNDIKIKDKEVQMLSILKEYGVRVPDILSIGKDNIIIDYINGPTLLDMVCRLEEEGSGYEKLAENLCLWLLDFYNASKAAIGEDLIFGDVNLRNFIMLDNIYGIDFEDCKEGCKEEDIGRMCAFILTYTPSFTLWKINFVRSIIDKSTEIIKTNEIAVREYMNDELKAIEIRRGIKFTF